MRFLDKLDILLTEEKDSYEMYPLDYDLESGVSFGVDLADSDTNVAKIYIKTIDGAPIDALGGNYNYDEVYADVDMSGDTNDPSKSELMLWVLKKLKNMGYDEQTIRLDGDVYHKQSNDLVSDDEEPVQSDSDFDVTDYWKSDEETDDSDSIPKFDNNSDNDSEIPKPADSTADLEAETTPKDISSDDEEDEESDEDESKFKKFTKKE